MNNKETVFSIANENKILRWVVIILAGSVSALTVGLLYKPEPSVWVVSQSGTIYRGDKEIISWEPQEVSRRVLDILFVPTDNRDVLIDEYFSDGLRSAVKGHDPKDRFIAFHIKNVNSTVPGQVEVDGVLQRNDREPVSIKMTLIQGPRTELNPFGLRVEKGSFDEVGK